MLDRHNLKASMFVSGIVAERYPDGVRAAQASGHEICAHGYAQDLLPCYQTPEQERETIMRCTDILGSVAHVRPKGWISPRATPSERTSQLLVEADYLHHGDCFDDDLPYVQPVGDRSIVAIPLSMDVNDLPTLIRYGNPAITILHAFRDTVVELSRTAETALIDITMHVHVAGRPYVATVYDRILSAVEERDDLWVATRSEIAAHVLATEK